MMSPLPYLPATGEAAELPFARFLPPDPPGMISRWLRANTPPPAALLDPLGASPRAALEMASAGCRVLVACNNPITAFETRLLARAVTAAELNAVIRELGDLKKGDERLESAIRGLYLTRCVSCAADIQATGFIWKRGEPLPHSRVFTCPRCAASGEHPVTDDDIQVLQNLQRSEQLHRSRAIARVMGASLEDKESVEGAIGIYPIRALYVLFTLINKLEGMNLPPPRRELLEALLLSLLDEGNALWPWPETRERPRQLTVPPQYIEKNLWLALDAAVAAWSGQPAPVPFTAWPELPAGNGICLYPGRMRDLNAEARGLKIERIVYVAPRPSQAFWSLCSLWSSWFWGGETAGRFSQVIERRRYDWHWHTTALHAALLPAAQLAGAGVPAFALVPEAGAGLVSAVIESASIAGFELAGCALRAPAEPVQLEWKTGQRQIAFQPVNAQRLARDAIRETLNEIGEPVEYLRLHSAALAGLARSKAFPSSIQQFSSEKAADLNTILSTLLADQGFLTRLDATAQEPESGLWWLADAANARPPLADRVELEVAGCLRQERQISADALRERVLQRFPGCLTPPETLLQCCADSYAVFDPAARSWKLKPHDLEAARAENAREMARLLAEIAGALGVLHQDGQPAAWRAHPAAEAPLYQFFVLTDAVIPAEALTAAAEGLETVLLIPGSRAGLLRYKMDRNPALRAQTKSRVRFLKFRALRGIAARSDLSLGIVKMLLDADPLIMEESAPLSMFR